MTELFANILLWISGVCFGICIFNVVEQYLTKKSKH